MLLLTFDDLDFESYAQLNDFGEVVRFPILKPREGPSILSDSSIDDYFAEHCAQSLVRLRDRETGVFVIHAHGLFSGRSNRQNLEGVTLLKHIRLSPWLGQLANWHAIVYSFESLESILKRKPDALILSSPGVTFLRLPEALDLLRAIQERHLDQNLTLDAVAANRASPTDRSFRPFVACSYIPPDSAHQTSNLWGVYDIHRCVFGIPFPEVSEAAQTMLPKPVLAYAQRLSTKAARWLDGERPIASTLPASLRLARGNLQMMSDGRKIIYVDDEAQNGWSKILREILVSKRTYPCVVVEPEASLLAFPDRDVDPDEYDRRIYRVAQWIHKQSPHLLILDLRLRGSKESVATPHDASGMALARQLRIIEPYLPIILFTASNKAETLAIAYEQELDDYWMKPGLGEHRGLATPSDDLAALVSKLTKHLSPDYAFLRKIAEAIHKIEASTSLFWWEMEIQWPLAVDGDRVPIPNQRLGLSKQLARPALRKAVLSILKPIVHELRLCLRVEHQVNDQATSSVSLALGMQRASVFNQIGKLIELIHGFFPTADPKTSLPDDLWTSGTIGGYGYWDYKAEKWEVFFRRCDWWAYQIFAGRNRWSHVQYRGAQLVGPTKEQLHCALSDLFAWLIGTRAENKKPLSANNMYAIRNKLRKFHGRPYPILRLFPDDPIKTPWGALLSPPSSSLVGDERFRLQLSLRPEFQRLNDMSEDFRKVTTSLQGRTASV